MIAQLMIPNNSADIVKELKKNGARYVRNDKEANLAVSRGQHVVLSLLCGDVLLVEEGPSVKCECENKMKCEHSVILGPWLAFVDDGEDTTKKNLFPIDILNSEINRIAINGYYLFPMNAAPTQNDEFTVIKRGGKPILDILKLSAEKEDN